MEGHRVKLTEVNPYLVCVLCHGYLVDATTIAECLHSFCRSCIFRQLERKSICPICETHVHNTKLYRSLRPDKTLQDIVYKLVPGLFHNEMQRRRDFYKNHPYRDEHLEPECRGVGLDRLIYSPDDQISLSLEFYDEEREKEEWSNNSSPMPPQFAPSGPKRYLQCPAGFKMLHLKKFLRQKYGLSSNCNVDIMYRRECLPDSYSLMDVAYIYTWKRNSPMRFYYRMPDVVMKQLTAPPPEIPSIESTKDSKENEEEKESIPKSPTKSDENKPEENKEDDKIENHESIAKVAKLEEIETPEKEKAEAEKKEEKPKTDKVVEPQTNSLSSSRALSKQDELSVSVLLSLGQCRVDNKDDHKFLMPNPVTPKNGIVEKKNGKISPKPSVNKIASDLAEHKAQQPQNSSPQILQNSISSPNQQLSMSPQQKQQHIQKQKQLQQMQQQKQKQQLKNQHLQQQKQQQFLHQKQQMHQLMQQQQQKLQQQLQQQHLLQQQQFQQIHLQQVQRHQLQQLQAHQPQILQLQVQPQLQLQQVIHQIKESKPQDQQSSHLPLQQQPMGEQPAIANQVKQVANQLSKVPKSPPVLHQPPVQSQSPQNLAQQQISQNLMQHQPQQHMAQLQPQQNLTQQQPTQHLTQQQAPQPQHVVQQQQTSQSLPQQVSQQSVQQQPTPSPNQQQLPLQAMQQLQQQQIQQQPTHQSVQQQQTQQTVTQQSIQAQSQLPLSQKSQNQQTQPHQSPQHQKSWSEPTIPENPPINGTAGVHNPQVTLNTSNGSVTIMAQLKSPPIVSSTIGGSVNNPGSPVPTTNGKSPEAPRPQGIHQNLPRTVLPKSPFVNGKPLQKSIQQKNISGQRLNNNLPEVKNGLIQQSNINNRLPTFQKNGGTTRKAGIPGGVIGETGPTLDQRIQQLYNSGRTNKPPGPGGKSESRLASWLNNRFKPQQAKEEPESTTPASPPTTKEVSMQRYKGKLQEMQKVQEICEITQENPKPDDAKRRREVTPDVSIELMRAADMKKLDSSKKEKRPVPGLKAIQEVGTKRKREEDSALDLSRPQLPWLLSRPTHYIPSPRPT